MFSLLIKNIMHNSGSYISDYLRIHPPPPVCLGLIFTYLLKNWVHQTRSTKLKPNAKSKKVNTAHSAEIKK